MRAKHKESYIGFTFNNFHSSQFGLFSVTSGDRYSRELLPIIEDYTKKIQGSYGSQYFGSSLREKTFNFKMVFKDLTEEEYREMTNWLYNNGEEGILILDETPFVQYKVKLVSNPVIKYIPFMEYIDDILTRIYKGEIDFNFISYSPFGESVHKFLDEYENDEEPLEWKDSCRMLPSIYTDNIINYDIYRRGGTLNTYNAGDIPTDFILTIPIINGSPLQITIALKNSNSFLTLSLTQSILGALNGFISIDTKTKVINFVDSNLITKNINNSIQLGNFFQLPIGYGTLVFTVGTSIPNWRYPYFDTDEYTLFGGSEIIQKGSGVIPVISESHSIDFIVNQDVVPQGYLPAKDDLDIKICRVGYPDSPIFSSHPPTGPLLPSTGGFEFGYRFFPFIFYYVSVKKSGFLESVYGPFDYQLANNPSQRILTLYGGDIDGNGIINATDVNLIAANNGYSYSSSLPHSSYTFREFCDLNSSQFVDSTDKNYAIGNIGRATNIIAPFSEAIDYVGQMNYTGFPPVGQRPEIIVKLYDYAGILLQETTSEDDPDPAKSMYRFPSIYPGKYYIEFSGEYIVSTISEIWIAFDPIRPGNQKLLLGRYVTTLYYGDFNQDGIIDNNDLLIITSNMNYGKNTNAALNPECDINKDGIIDNHDYDILIANLGKKNKSMNDLRKEITPTITYSYKYL